MKTNVVMIRKMGDFDIRQRTSDGYFNANALLFEWNQSRSFIGRRKMSEFLESKQTVEFLQVLENEVSRKSPTSNVYYTIKGKTDKLGIKHINQVWMHPYLFLDFAMWINPKFKLEVIRFVYDQLITCRHLAGDNYKGLTKSLTMFNNVNYSQVAKGINYIVFGKHEENLRQNASEEQLKELNDVQQKLAFAIDMGYIRSFDELLNEMRKMWFKKKNENGIQVY